MMRSKTTVVGCILACLAVAGIASSANAAVFAGVVGGPGSIHMQYGPQDDPTGDYLGIAAESYEGLWDWGSGFWASLPGPPTGTSYPGENPSFILLAFDPYTGEVWNRVPDEHKGLAGGSTYYSYPAHPVSAYAVGEDGGGSPIYSDVVQADMGRGWIDDGNRGGGYTEDTIFITSMWRDYRPYFLFGMTIGTSPDGGLLGSPTELVGEETPIQAPAERALLSQGDEVRPYGAGEALPVFDPAFAGQAQDFSHTETYGQSVWWEDPYSGAYDHVEGLSGEAGLFGFEMDGIRGWMRLDFSIRYTDDPITYAVGVGGVRLTEYYFDIPEPATMSLLAIGGIAALIRRRK